MDLRAALCVLAMAAAFAAGLPTDPMAVDAQQDAPAASMVTLAMPEAAMQDPSAMQAAAEAVAEAVEAEAVARGFASREQPSAAEVARAVYAECVSRGSFACVKPRVLAFLSAAARQDVIPITRDLIIERTARDYAAPVESEGASAGDVVERVDAFLRTHALRVRLPRELREGALPALVPAVLLRGLPTELRLPLADGHAHPVGQERGFLKKIVMPFLLGLKFKATALVPLALALIAVKTWKALTLGLLSLVLSAALVIFKFTKPKVVNYEVIHYPHAPQVVEHPVAMPYDHHGYGRALPDAQQMAYSAYAPQ